MVISYKWLQTYFTEPLPSPEKIAEVLTFGVFEIESTEKKDDDTIFDVKVLPDRAHDCLSHRGIARELGTLLDLPLKKDEETLVYNETETILRVRVDDPALCRRYVGRIIRGLTVGPSPAWLTERLSAIGQRPINNIVDATNYVMFDIGQPLHAFDAKKLSGGISVRSARKGENITTLDKKEIVLPEGTLIIADNTEPLAIAGVKGGTRAGVDENTTEIVLEAANFDPVLVRRVSRGLSIITDSSKRLENELTPELAREAMDRVTALIIGIAGGEKTIVEKIVDEYPKKQDSRTISLSTKEVNRLLGTDLSDDAITGFLDRLHFSFEKKESPAVFAVSVPSERIDLKETADLIEDIAHVYGYRNIPSVAPSLERSAINKKFYYATFIRNELVRGGFSEIYGYSFASNGEIELQNSLGSERAFLRANLTDGVLDALSKNATNASLLGLSSIRIFEFGNVFLKSGEKTLLAVGVHHLKKMKEGILRATLGNLAEKIGAPSLPVIGGYDLSDDMREVVAIDMDTLVVALPEPEGEYMLPESMPMQYRPFSLFPFITRDIAVWVSEGTAESAITDIIVAEGGGLLVQGPTLFDEFKKDGKISYAFRFVFQARDRTLTDEETNAIMDGISVKLRVLGFDVR